MLFERLIANLQKSNALNYILVAIFGIFSFAMLFQSYAPILPLTMYVVLVALFIGGIAFCILFGREAMAVVAIFLFSIVVRLMYYVSTRFSVLPYGDPYSQYSVLLSIAESSSVSIFPSSPNYLNFLTRIPHQYSQWPGLEVFATSFSRITNLPLFWTALMVPFILYSVWFVVSYAIVKKIFSRMTKAASTLSLLSIGIASALPTFEMPPIFKYDFLAAVFLLTVFLLLIHPFEKQLLEKSVLLAFLVMAIVVTHSITALFLMIIVVVLGIAYGLKSMLSPLRWFRGFLAEPSRRSSNRGRSPFLQLMLFVLGCVVAWWAFYATFIISYASKGSQFLLSSISFGFLSSSRVGGQKGSTLASLTPHWLFPILHYRDELLLILVALGAVVLILRPKIFGKQLMIPSVMIAVGVATLLTEALQTLNFGDRAFLTFAPILACFMVMPVVAIVYFRPSLGKLCGILILGFFLFAIALGFWGSSYAPVFLYSSNASAYAFGEHPTNWQEVATYLNYGTPSSSSVVNTSIPACITTNEIYVTSLVVPVQKLGITYTFQQERERPGCIAIIYDSLAHFNNSYIGEPSTPYAATNFLPAFSLPAYEDLLSNKSDLVFNGGNTTVYYAY